MLAEYRVDGVELIAFPNVLASAWAAGAEKDMLDAVLLGRIEVQDLEGLGGMVGIAGDAECGGRHLRTA